MIEKSPGFERNRGFFCVMEPRSASGSMLVRFWCDVFWKLGLSFLKHYATRTYETPVMSNDIIVAVVNALGTIIAYAIPSIVAYAFLRSRLKSIQHLSVRL
jgi:hypothetical protein